MKERLNVKEAIATNGSEGTVSNKTQVLLKLLEEGMHCVCNNIASINNDYPVPHTEFANVNLMRPLPSKGINPEFESTMKEFVEKYRLLRQRTVREETNKEKARALPPAVYTKKEESIKVDLLVGLGNDFNT